VLIIEIIRPNYNRLEWEISSCHSGHDYSTGGQWNQIAEPTDEVATSLKNIHWYATKIAEVPDVANSLIP
jgi:hypothetical protein